MKTFLCDCNQIDVNPLHLIIHKNAQKKNRHKRESINNYAKKNQRII